MILETHQLNLGYGDIQILWDINVRIGEREIVALAGSNGAGKSTLLKGIIGILKPMSGEIRFQKRDISWLPPSERVPLGISLIPEGRELFYWMTVEENILMGAYSRKDTSGVKNDLKWIFNLFPILEERKHQQAVTLSGGEQQMCAIARGLLSSPRLLLLDELSLGLAPVMVDRLVQAIREIHQSREISIFLVEQDVQTGFELASRGYIIETGRIVAEDSSQNLLNDNRIREAYLGI
ncbi:MAG: ABC transporter ATP-binding protein [Desulfobacterales bacterium]|jgi:branched-chain amino acid transport system ATP-binding protein|nr:ABC transporter ATP-binding protein [Desulfobacterales bacterium]